MSNSAGKVSAEDTLTSHFKAMMFGDGTMKANVSSNTQSAFNNILQENLGENNMRREAGREQIASRSFDNKLDLKVRNNVEPRENNSVRNFSQEKNTQERKKNTYC